MPNRRGDRQLSAHPGYIQSVNLAREERGWVKRQYIKKEVQHRRSKVVGVSKGWQHREP
jgi:hypothetical protein